MQRDPVSQPSDRAQSVERDALRSRWTCPTCGASLVEIKQKLVCPDCRTICETCCEGGRG